MASAGSSNMSALARNYVILCQQCSTLVTHQQLSPIKMRTVFHRGLPWETAHPNDKLHPWTLMKLFKFARVSSFWDPNNPISFLDLNNLQSYLTFMASVTLEVDRQVYNSTLKPGAPMTIDIELDFCGKTSFKLKKQMYFDCVSQNSGSNPEVIQEMQGVFIDHETRRPTPPPAWWKRKFASHACVKGRPLFLQPVEIPENLDVQNECAEVDITVKASDVDPYCHLCSSNFIKVCMDAFLVWNLKQVKQSDENTCTLENFESISDGREWKDNKGGSINDEVLKKVEPISGEKYAALHKNPLMARDFKSMSQNFKGEAGIGDVLTVKFWPQGSESSTEHVCFLVLKNGGVVFDTVVEFHST